MKPRSLLAGVTLLAFLTTQGICDRGGQMLAAGNGAASSSRSHTLRVQNAGMKESPTRTKLERSLQPSARPATTPAAGVEETGKDSSLLRFIARPSRETWEEYLNSEAPIGPLNFAETIGQLDPHSFLVGGAYLLGKKPTVFQVEKPLRSRTREYGVYGFKLRGKSRLVILPGKEGEVFGGSKFDDWLFDFRNGKRSDPLLFIHNHDYSTAFPSHGDFGYLENLEWDYGKKIRSRRNFVYGPRTGRLIAYGIRDRRQPSDTREIRVRLWKDGWTAPEEQYIDGTAGWVLSDSWNKRLLDRRLGIFYFYGLLRRRGMVRVEMEDYRGHWARWDSRVTLASELKQANLVASAGLEEREAARAVVVVAEAVQGPGVVVIGPEALETRAGLEELIRRAPPALARRIILYGVGAVLAKRLRELNSNIGVIAEEDLTGLTLLLLSMPEAEKVTVIGLLALARQLEQILPATMSVSHLDPGAAFRLILAAMGVPKQVLDQIDVGGLESALGLGREA